MTEQHIAILRHLVAAAQSADMDVALSVDILIALLNERNELIDALGRLVHLAECNTFPGPNTLAHARAAIAKAGAS